MAHLTEEERHIAYLDAQALAYALASKAYSTSNHTTAEWATMWAHVAQALRKDRV